MCYITYILVDLSVKDAIIYFLLGEQMEPNPHYVSMLMNIGIFALLVYVAINV